LGNTSFLLHACLDPRTAEAQEPAARTAHSRLQLALHAQRDPLRDEIREVGRGPVSGGRPADPSRWARRVLGDTHPRGRYTSSSGAPPSTPRLPARTPDGRHINYVVSIPTRFPLNPTGFLSLCGSLYRTNPVTYEGTIRFSFPPSIRFGDRANVVAVADVKALATTTPSCVLRILSPSAQLHVQSAVGTGRGWDNI
jgi:hypothetical protein